ncbi:hypothetical protein [Vibrio phage vB_VpaP_SJSY21]|nr:hypothetical protein [Vibrio phage vB_VpaP_SJSY21]
MTPEQKSVMKQFVEGGHLGLILKDIKLSISQEILDTSPDEANKREELYYLTRALDQIDFKLQSCANFEIDGDNYEY